MSDPILPLLVGIIAALLCTGAAAGLIARGGREAVGFLGAGLGGLGCLLCLLTLLLGEGANQLVLPFGPPGLTLHLVLDPVAAFFLLLVFAAGTAGSAVAAETGAKAPPSSLAGVVLCLAGAALALLAADAAALALGLSLVGAAIWASGDAAATRAPQLTVAGLTALAALGAIGLSGFTFAEARTHPAHPAGLLLLALLGPGALAGLAPFHAWMVPAHAAAPARAAALLSGVVAPLAVYLMLRLVLDLAGPAIPLWWGMPLLGMGIGGALIGGWHAASGAELDRCAAALTVRQSGLAAIGIGLAAIGRALDLPNVTVLAVAGVLMLALAQAVCGTLAQLAAGAVRTGAGSRRLTLLGGLATPMPVVTAGMGAALFGLSALPLSAGFAGVWLLVQAVLAAPRSAGLAIVAAALGVSAALAGVALVRIFGVAFLGRPRGPRSAGAMDIAKAEAPGLLVLAGAATLIGLFPGPVLLLAEPAIRQLAGTGLDGKAGWFGLTATAGLPGYRTLPLLLLALAIAGAAVWLARRRLGAAPRQGRAWNDGFAPPPDWLPFGDPLTQSAGAGFLPALPSPPPRFRVRVWRRWRLLALPLLLAALTLLLVVALWAGAA